MEFVEEIAVVRGGKGKSGLQSQKTRAEVMGGRKQGSQDSQGLESEKVQMRCLYIFSDK